MSKTTHDDLVLEALAYRRNVGATIGEIRTYLLIRQANKRTLEQDLALLHRLKDEGRLYSVGKRWFFTSSGHTLAKGPALDAEWQPEDAWILLAMLYNSGVAEMRLPQIIAAADHINHAILTLEEMHGALNRFLAAGLIKTKRDTFCVTDKALVLFDKVQASCKRGVLDQLEGLRQIMDCPCCGVRLKSVRWRVMLEEGAYQEAVEAYLSMVW